MPQEIVVDEVDRRPWHEHVQQQAEEVRVVHQKVVAGNERNKEGYDKHDRGGDGAGRRFRLPVGSERLADGQRRQGSAVQVHRIGSGDAEREDGDDDDCRRPEQG